MKNLGPVIRSIQLTEKATTVAETQNKYLFKVDRSANKMEIKRAVEDVFNVAVEAVNTMNMTGKRKRERTVRFGRRPDWKRAVVTLRAGNKIDLV